MKNQFLFGFTVALIVFSLIGCSSILSGNKGVFGKASKKNDEIGARIEQVTKAQAQTDAVRLTKIGSFAKGGVEYSLNQIPDTNLTKEVVVAKEMNQRVEALANKPDFKEVEAIQSIVDQLLSEVDKTKAEGKKALEAKDKELFKMEQLIKDLNSQKDSEVAAALKLADANAAAADQYKATLGQMDSWFGLGAIFYGAKKFLVSSMWILGIGGVLFLILRILSMSNPIAASLFSIFNMMGSWVINIIKVIVPKAVDMAGHVTQGLFNAYKSTLTKLVDAIQQAKLDAVKTGKPVDIKTILDEVAKTMNSDEKSIIDEIKKALNY